MSEGRDRSDGGMPACRAAAAGGWREFAAWWRGAGRLARMVAASSPLLATMYGGTKSANSRHQPMRSAPPAANLQGNAVRGRFSGLEQATGYCVVTNPAAIAVFASRDTGLAQFPATANAAAHRPWLATGVFDDYFAIEPDTVLRLGASAVRRLVVFSHGHVRAMLDDGGAADIAPFRAPMSFPASNLWERHSATSRCWTATSPASAIVTWEGALLGRDPAAPLTVQLELLPNGDFICRYGDDVAFDGDDATPFAAFSLCGPVPPFSHAASVTGAVARASSLYFKNIAAFGDGTGDTDGDGLTDHDEITMYGTDPLVADTDHDGLDDCRETSLGTDPLDFDENGDGLADGWDLADYQSHPLWAPDSPDVEVTLESDLPPGVSALLRINDLPVVLHSATNLPLRCAEGGMLEFAILNPSRAPVPLSLSVFSGSAYRLENNGLFQAGGLRRAMAALGGAGGGSGTARLVFPSLSLTLDDPGVTSCNGGTCIHGCDGGVRFRLDAEPSGCTELSGHIACDGFTADGASHYRFFPPPGEDGIATLSIEDGWLTQGSVSCSVAMHLAQFIPGASCPVCGIPHPPGFCEGGSPYDDGAGLGRFLRIGEVTGVGDGWSGWASHCCGSIGWPLVELALAGSSANLDVAMRGGDGMDAEGTGASRHPGADHIDYRVEMDGGGIFEDRMHFTVADIRLHFDYDGDGAISRDEKDRAADAQTNSAARAWAIPHRPEPYRVDCVVHACDELSVHASWPNDSGDITDLATDAPSGFPEIENHDGPNTFWFATTNRDSLASFGLSLSHQSVTAPLLVETLEVHVRGMELGERWTARNSHADVEYWYPSIDGEPFWTLVARSNTVVATSSGNAFSIAPASLDAGDYKVTVLDPDLVREGFSCNTATGTLHIVETRLSTNSLTIVRNAMAGSASGRVRLALTDDSTQTANWEISPSTAGGARLYASATGGVPRTEIANAAAVWVGAGEYTGRFSVTATHPHCPQSHDSCAVEVVDMRMAPDYDFRNAIGEGDFSQAATNRAFTLWLNDDDDNAEYVGHEVPGRGASADSANEIVDGLGDLIDWFPLCLDLGQAHRSFPLEHGYSYRLAQEDNALSFIWTSLTPSNAGAFLTADVQCAGADFGQSLTNAPVARMANGHMDIPDDWLLVADDCPICLVEGRNATASPLALEVMLDNEFVARVELPLRVTGIEDMFRFSNLRGYAGQNTSVASRLGVPPHRPYVPDGRNVFLVHGFLVGENESRGWGSEFFKKLLRSGSRADFWMVTWRGDQRTSADYYLNVDNAFLSAPYLAGLVNSVQGEKVILAHSLGNMAVSSAIQDCGMQVGKYFAINSAVASEAYDATLFDDRTSNPLVHSGWLDYTNICWSANYHALFDADDDRAKLTWRGRFADVPLRTEMYNFYSSGDEVLEIAENGVPNVAETVLDFIGGLLGMDGADTRRYAWHKQENFKGRSWLYGTGWAGWGFEYQWQTHESANAMTLQQLRDNPVFENDPSEMFSGTINQAKRNEILAHGIPALSRATGVQNLSTILDSDHRINMNSATTILRPNGWIRNSSAYEGLWLHTDIQNIPYFFTFKLFDTMKEKIQQ